MLLTSNQVRLIAAKESGFCAIPVVSYLNLLSNNYQLSLVQKYLLKINDINDLKTQVNKDFGFLTQMSQENPVQQEEEEKK